MTTHELDQLIASVDLEPLERREETEPELIERALRAIGHERRLSTYKGQRRSWQG
ncbi:MAG: hypothetical protein ABSD62_15345 [Candidatus Limnocylindrales bacterium]|jgi:hypothetical protein